MLTAGMCVRTYQTVALLSCGGTGQVFPADDCSRDRDVALTVLPEAVAAGATRLEWFARPALARSRRSIIHTA